MIACAGNKRHLIIRNMKETSRTRNSCQWWPRNVQRFIVARLNRRPVCIHSDVQEQTARRHTHTTHTQVQINRQVLQVARSASVLLQDVLLIWSCCAFVFHFSSVFMPLGHQLMLSFKGTVHWFSPRERDAGRHSQKKPPQKTGLRHRSPLVFNTE